MEPYSFIYELGIIIVCAAGLSALAVALRQPIILAYLLCGVFIGPWGLGLVPDVDFVDGISRFGVTLLLFLAGIVLHPQRLAELFRKTLWVTLISSLVSCIIAFLFATAWGFTPKDSVYIGLALMFSSTILVIKLMPTTALHHKHMGAACIAVLIAQDIIAVGILWFMRASGSHTFDSVLYLPVKGAVLIAFTFFVEQFVLRPVMRYSERFHETLYLLCLGWCLGIALLAKILGFSVEVGAFLAGVAIARSPLSLFFSEGLKVFRDFFMVLFFFVLGARLNPFIAREVVIPAFILSAVFILVKPLLFDILFKTAGEQKKFSREASWRLGQLSEFSLIIALFAAERTLISPKASQFIQITAILSIVISSYIVVFSFPTPLGFRRGLQQN
jgi:Kef-type K+ transport system membrane component KefB